MTDVTNFDSIHAYPEISPTEFSVAYSQVRLQSSAGLLVNKPHPAQRNFIQKVEHRSGAGGPYLCPSLTLHIIRIVPTIQNVIVLKYVDKQYG